MYSFKNFFSCAAWQSVDDFLPQSPIFGHPKTEQHVYLPYYEVQKSQTRKSLYSSETAHLYTWCKLQTVVSSVVFPVIPSYHFICFQCPSSLVLYVCLLCYSTSYLALLFCCAAHGCFISECQESIYSSGM